jgi:small acid-soluble spore protein A (major alpha-type SASP)
MPNNNEYVVSQARQGLQGLKQQVASQLGLGAYTGYQGDRPSRENGKVGGQMVKTMIAIAEQQLTGGAVPAVTPAVAAAAGTAPGTAGLTPGTVR